MLFKKLIRTAGRYKAQFISMIIMTALGIGMFLGFNMEWVSIEENINSFFASTNFADYRIFSEDGFTQEDLEKILPIAQDATRYLSVNADVAGTSKALAVTVSENFRVSNFVVMEGEAYDPESVDGLWLFDKFAQANDIRLGDTLELKYEQLSIKGQVKALIESSEYLICLQDESQMMPSFDSFGYVYISPKMLEEAVAEGVKEQILEEAQKRLGNNYSEAAAQKLLDRSYDSVYEEVIGRIYPQINVISDMDKTAFKEAVRDALGKTYIVLTKEENVSYEEAMGEANEGKTMGSVLPVLFLLISVLTMITTMHRIASNEKTQIGTLKALGFKDGKIRRHYCSYALLIGVVGTAIGIGLGYLVAWYIMNPNGMMGTYLAMPEWKLFIPWWCWVIMAAMIALMVLIGSLSIRQMMKGTAADALRPYVPKVSRKMLLERTSLWERLRFGTKWNLRDIFRHKSRSAVTLIGVIGCMVLMVGAIGMYETAGAFIQTTYTDNARYASKIFVSTSAEGSTNEKARELAQEYEGDYSASIGVQINDETYSLDIFHIDHDLVRFMDKDNHNLQLRDDGAFASLRIQEKYNLQEGDELTLSFFGSDAVYKVKIVGFNRSMTQSITMSDVYASTLTYDGISLTDSDDYHIDSIYTTTAKTQIGEDALISSVQSRTDIVESMNSFMEILYMSVMVLVLAAIVLGIVVLYNLGVMSYVERYREMATLKVVGFRNTRIKRLLIGQSAWLTVLGIILGMFAGIWVVNYIMYALAPEYEMKVVIGPLTVFVSIAVTAAVSLLVGLMVARKSKNIDMVVALKTPE